MQTLRLACGWPQVERSLSTTEAGACAPVSVRRRTEPFNAFPHGFPLNAIAG